MNKICKKLEDNVMKIFLIFLYIQPILDVATGISLNKYSFIVSISSVVRFIFLIFCIFYILFISKKNMKYLLLIFLYCIFYVIGMINLNHDLVFEIKNLLYTIYMPITLLFTLSIFKNNKFDNKHLYIILLIYTMLIFIPDIFNIGFNSYWHSKQGSVGFFYSANAVGNILSILCPLLLANLIVNKKYIKIFIFLTLYLYVTLKMGTKAPILFFLIIALYYFILLIVNLIKKKKYIILITSLLIITILVVVAYKYLPYTSFYTNLVIHLNYLNIHSFSDLLTFKNIDHFLFGSRFSFFGDYIDIYNNSPFYNKLFGIGYLMNDGNYKLIEMDFFDTFIHHGIIGFVIIYFIYFKTLLTIFKYYFKNFKKNFVNIEKSSYIVSIIISFIGALFIGHLLATPTVTIFIVTVLSIAILKMQNQK